MSAGVIDLGSIGIWVTSKVTEGDENAQGENVKEKTLGSNLKEF